MTESLGITTKVSVQNFKFEVVQSKVARTLSNEVAFNQIFKEVLTANQNSFIHIQFEVYLAEKKLIFFFFFKLKFDDKKAVPIKQIAVRLNHPDYRFSTNLINAVYDENSHVYKAVIDLGDPVINT